MCKDNDKKISLLDAENITSIASLEEAMKDATSASAITVTRNGSIISIPIGSEVFSNE